MLMAADRDINPLVYHEYTSIAPTRYCSIIRYDTSGRSAVGIAVVAPFWPHSKCSF